MRTATAQVEVHFHHGVDSTHNRGEYQTRVGDFSRQAGRRTSVTVARDREALPKYAFVHGNGRWRTPPVDPSVEVDSEMAITCRDGLLCGLHSALGSGSPQVPRLNAHLSMWSPAH